MWRDIIGHENLIGVLSGFVRTGKLPHALLFTGPAGVGKTMVAREFFKAVNCLKSPGRPCDSCRSCLKMRSGFHPDFITVGPSEDRTVILIGDIRKAISEVSLKPFEAHTRVVVVEPAERMNNAGANALLKTLEEPPDATLIILVSHNPSLLLPTIISRCQVLRFAPLDAAAFEKGPLSPALLRLTSGTMGGLKDFDEEQVLRIRSEILQALREGDPVRLVSKYFPAQEKGGELLPIVVLLAESLIRDLLIMVNGGEDLINEELRGLPVRGSGYPELEDAATCLRSIRRGASENIRLPNALSELFMRLQQMLFA
jgi:DNA polymerase-3 subunit delta'